MFVNVDDVPRIEIVDVIRSRHDETLNDGLILKSAQEQFRMVRRGTSVPRFYMSL